MIPFIFSKKKTADIWVQVLLLGKINNHAMNKLAFFCSAYFAMTELKLTRLHQKHMICIHLLIALTFIKLVNVKSRVLWDQRNRVIHLSKTAFLIRMNRDVNKKHCKFHIALEAREILWERIRTEVKTTEVCTLLRFNISKALMAIFIETYIIKNHWTEIKRTSNLVL